MRQNKKRSGKEFWINSQVVGFKIRDTMLDLGSNVNILPRKTWEAMGKPPLKYSSIHLRMVNQYCILPIGRLENVEVDLVGVKTHTKFEMIDIMGDKDPYIVLLGIDWAYENYVVIDLKKEMMIFKVEGIRAIQPLDPYQGPKFTEPVDDKDEPGMLDQPYMLTAGKGEDYINPTTGGFVSWRGIQSSKTSSKAAWDAWC